MKTTIQIINKLFIYGLLLLSPSLLYCQKPLTSYHKLDSIAKTAVYEGDLKVLTYNLTHNYTAELEKARAIFIWITDNIAYDYKWVNKNKKTKPFKCKGNDNCDVKYAKWHEDYLDKIIRRKKAVCQGYSELFTTMCGYAGLQCSTVPGYIKNSPSHIGRLGVLDHAWNVIHINGDYYFADATWAAGFCPKDKKGKLKKFIKELDEYYWLTPRYKFYRNHFPKDSAVWTPDYNVAKEKFRNTPYIKGSELPLLQILSPESGVLEIYPSDTIIFKIEYADAIEHLQINTNLKHNPPVWKHENGERIWDEKAFKKQEYIKYTRDGNVYTFQYSADRKNLRYIEILFDYSLVIKYKVTATPL